MVEFFRDGQEKTEQGRVRRGKLDIEMIFTGCLIEDLITTVERAERRAHSNDPLFAEEIVAEPISVETWFGSVQQNTEYDSRFLGVA